MSNISVFFSSSVYHRFGHKRVANTEERLKNKETEKTLPIESHKRNNSRRKEKKKEKVK